MKNMLNNIQKEVLSILLDKYEDSKTYRGENQVTQTFEISPFTVFNEYESDYADINLVRDFEHQMSAKLIANTENWRSYYTVLKRIEKRTLQREQIEFYESCLGINELLDHFCHEQIDRLNSNKKAKFELKDAKKIIQLCKFILDNNEDILERELSIAILGDSKLWEQKYRTRVCGLLLHYGKYEDVLFGVDDEKEKR